MIEHYCPSLSLKRGLRVKDYESIDELENAANEKGACLRVANKYIVEKSALVTGRDTFATKLEEKTGFKMRVTVKEKKKTDGTTERIEEPSETEVQYVTRFRKAVLDGTFTHQAFPNEENALEEALQTFADSLGAFVASVKPPEPTSAKPKISKWIAERVAIILQNGTQEKWWSIMQNEGIPIEPLSEDKEKNALTLSLAIKEREARREMEESRKYS